MSFDISNIPSLPRIHTKPALLKPEYVEVVSAGELVTIHFGNTPVSMHYEDALRISQFIRLRAKEAKRRAGDESRHWSAVALLEDLNEKKTRMY